MISGSVIVCNALASTNQTYIDMEVDENSFQIDENMTYDADSYELMVDLKSSSR